MIIINVTDKTMALRCLREEDKMGVFHTLMSPSDSHFLPVLSNITRVVCDITHHMTFCSLHPPPGCVDYVYVFVCMFVLVLVYVCACACVCVCI